ncbi:hypothetical protein SAMN05216216_1181 [Lacicoccus qingdaonensis]|uniref:Uncharacterized protein n=2 Tax=Lacicoccus qingdaonensis TaxID=576118 RepID=A0A1G9GLE9_9BACL|nr:hypothetical protein SAMN05216216_1181 [Salinicoccus qingdaonensis]
MKLRVFRNLLALLFLAVLAGVYFINPDAMSWTLFISVIIVYTVFEMVISFIIAGNRSEDDDYRNPEV